MIKYVVCPGKVTSKVDGDQHYVNAMDLMRLYRVDPRECEIYQPAPWWLRSDFMAAEERHKGLIVLAPRCDGDYTLPTMKLSNRVRANVEAAPWVIEEIRKLEADAERYRWLRDECRDPEIRSGLGLIGQELEIDAAIDAAMKEN